MLKPDMIAVIKDINGITNQGAKDVLNTLFAGMAKSLVAGQDVHIEGIGTLKVSVRLARTGRNPRTGESIQIPEKKTVTLTVGAELKRALNA